VPPDPDILISPEVINVLPSRSTAVPQPQPQPQPDPQPQPEVRPTLPSQGVVISVDPDTRMAIVLTNEGLKVRPATGAFTYDADLLSKLPQNLLPSDRDRTAGVDAGTVIIGNRVTVGGKDIGSLDPTTGRFTVTDTTPTGQTPEQEQNPARARGTVIDVNAANNTAFVLQPSGELVPVRAVDPATQRQLQVGEQVRVDVPTGTATTTVADVAPQTRPDAGPSQKPGGLPLPLPLPGPEGKDKPEVKPEGDPLPFPFVDPVVQPIPLPDIQVQPQPQPKPEGEPLPFPFVQPLPIPLPLPDIQVQPQPQPQPEGEPLPFPFVDPLPFPLPLPDIQVQPIPSPPTEGAPILPPEFVPPPEIVPPVEIEVQPPNIPETGGEPIPFPDLEYPPELIDDPFFNIGTPTVPPVEGEEITLPEFEEPPITDITTDINVLDPLVIRPATVPKVRVPPGTRLVGASQLTPTRVALSEEPGEGVYGTPEEEQQPVWNIRSLKLRKALRI